MSVELWVEKYRPTTLDEYVWRDPQQRVKVEEWLRDGALPNLLFSGVQGTGKTSLALLLLRELGIPTGDILKLNASGKDRLIDGLQDRITSFVSSWALGPTGIKYILLDEADSMSPLAQRMLRGEMETYSDSCRFIFTCNYPKKLIPAIHSRLQQIDFQALDVNEYAARAGEILTKESVAFDVEVLLEYVEATYPDLRKCIQLLQQNTTNNSLDTYNPADTGTKDYIVEMADLFRAGRYLDARKMVVAQATLEEYPDIFRFMYRNLDLWGNTQDQQDEALLIIRRGVLNHAVIADPELNLAATLVELTRLRA